MKFQEVYNKTHLILGAIAVLYGWAKNDLSLMALGSIMMYQVQQKSQ